MSSSKDIRNSAILPLLSPDIFSGIFTSQLGADIWINRMNKIKAFGHFSDQDMIFMVGDYMVDFAEEWYQIIGSSKTSWSDFTNEFRTCFVSTELVKQQKQGIKNAFQRALEKNKNKDSLKKLASNR